MNIQQLIEQLKKFDGNTEVYIATPDKEGYYIRDEIVRIEEYTFGRVLLVKSIYNPQIGD